MCPAICLVVGTLVSNFSWSLLFIYLHSYCPNGFDIKNHERASTISKDLSGRWRLLILKKIFLYECFICVLNWQIQINTSFFTLFDDLQSQFCMNVYQCTLLKNWTEKHKWYFFLCLVVFSCLWHLLRYNNSSWISNHNG